MTTHTIRAILVGIIVCAVAASIALFAGPKKIVPSNTSPVPAPASAPAPSSEQPLEKVPAAYTSAEVAAHGTPSDCWTSVNGSVFDLTAWISRHPGGERAILSLCGIDGSAAFNAQHGGQSRPESALESFKIGTLK